MDSIDYRVSPPLSDERLNELFATAWAGHEARSFAPVLARSLVYIAAFDGERLVGYVNVSWDGGVHAFLLDTTTHREYQRRGIGTELVVRAARAAGKRGLEWLHVDFEPHLEKFYRDCGFRPTAAGLINLRSL